MFCCPNCFSHTFLKNEIKKQSHQAGVCSFCNNNRKNVPLITPSALLDLFQPLFDLYKQDSNGILLNNILQDDWRIFSKCSNKEKQLLLLTKITGNENIVMQRYFSTQLFNNGIIDDWKAFTKELKHENRFFPQAAINPDQLSELFDYLVMEKKRLPNFVYRARLNTSNTPFAITEMGKPTLNKSKAGRANPNGISYFYALSEAKTSIAEKRPSKSEYVSVAKFKVAKKISLIDLRDPKSTISPFGLDDDDLMLLYTVHMPFLVHLCNSLSQPVLRDNSELEYLPTQYLCEFIKDKKFNGIAFKSSLEKGDNYVFFDDSFLNGITVENFLVSEIAVKTIKAH